MADFSSVTKTAGQFFTCDVCEKSFQRKYHLTEHALTHRNSNPYKCNQCGKQFKILRYLRRHERRIHVKPKLEQPSDQRGTLLFTETEQDWHMHAINSMSYPNVLKIRNITKIAEKTNEVAQSGNHLKHLTIYRFVCDYPKCDYESNTKYPLEIHKRTHSAEKPFTCPDCGEAFNSQTKCNIHMRKHTGIYPFKCDQSNCSYKCLAERQLENHKRSKHTGERPYKCNECERGFASSSALKSHTIAHHTGNYPYTCEICDRKFLFKTPFHHHMRTHTRIYPLQCDQRNSRYKCLSKHQLENHKRSKHTGERPYKCNECEREFASPYALKSHTIAHHTSNYSYSCEICDRKFLFKTALQHHQQIHTGERPHNNKSWNKCSTKTIDALTSNATVKSIEVEDASLLEQINLLGKNEKGINLGKQNALSTAELIHLQDTNLLKLQKIYSSSSCKDSIPVIVNETKEQVCQSAANAIDFNSDIIPTNSSLCNAEKSTSLERERDQNSQSATEHTCLENIQLVTEINPEHESVKSCKGSTKQTGDKNILSVADVIHMHDSDIIPTNSPLCNAEKSTSLERERDQNSQSATERTCLKNIQLVTEINPEHESVKSCKSSTKQTGDKNILSVADVIYMHDSDIIPTNSPLIIAEKSTSLEREKDQNSQSATKHTCLENIQLVTDINPEHESVKSCKSSTKQTEDKNILSVADLIHMHDSNTIPTNSPLCNAEKSTSLERERDQNSQSATEHTCPANIHQQVTKINPEHESVKSYKNFTKQTEDKNILSVADVIHVHDVIVEKISSNHQISPPVVTTIKCSTSLEKERDQQDIHSASEPTDVVNIGIEIPQRNVIPTSVENNTSLVTQINPENTLSVADLIHLYDLNLEARTIPTSPHTEKSLSMKKQNKQHIFQSDADLVKPDNSSLYNTEKSMGVRQRGTQHIDDSKIKVIDLDDDSLETLSVDDLGNTSLPLSTIMLNNINSSDTNAASLNPTECHNVQAPIHQKCIDMNVQKAPETPIVISPESNACLIKESCKSHRNAASNQIYSNNKCFQIPENEPEQTAGINNCVISSTQINNDPEKVMKTQVPQTLSAQTTATPQSFLLDSDAFLVQRAGLKFARIILERIDGNGLCNQVATVNIGGNTEKSSSLNEVLYKRQKLNSHKLQRIGSTKSLKGQLTINDKSNQKPALKKKKHKRSKKWKEKRLYSCEECGKKLCSNRAKNSHLRIHTGERPYKCGECGKLFISSKALGLHMLIHTDKYSFVCDQPNCGYKANKKIYLEAHRHSKHTGQRPFVCGECGNTYITKASLCVHKVKHTGKYSWACDQANCSYKCLSWKQLGNHKRSKHTGEKPYVCGKCGKKFASTNAVDVHSRRHT